MSEKINRSTFNTYYTMLQELFHKHRNKVSNKSEFDELYKEAYFYIYNAESYWLNGRYDLTLPYLKEGRDRTTRLVAYVDTERLAK